MGTSSSRNSPVIGIYHENPDNYLSSIQELLPDQEIRVCRRWDELDQIINEINILLAFKFGKRTFPKELILSGERLAWVQLASAGVDHMVPFSGSELLITNASGIHGITMSQFVFGAIVHHLWDFPRLVEQQERRVWKRFDVGTLSGKTLGVIGAGHIGTTIARTAATYGMRSIGVRRSGRSVEGFHAMYKPDQLAAVLEVSDVLIVSTPLTPETRGLIGPHELAQIKEGSIFVNVSRGGVVDENSLAQSLREGRIAHAILDVFAEEPLPASSEFWTMSNVFVTPHISSEAFGWDSAVADLFLENLQLWRASMPLKNRVDPMAGY